MESLLPILLVSTALAFVAGWLLCKALLAHLFVLQQNEPENLAVDIPGLDDRDAQIAELRLQLDKAEARDLRWKRIFRGWRARTRHVTRQFRQQRLIIAELRDELRRREAAAVAAQKGQLSPKQAPQKKASVAVEGQAADASA
jgi:hypothetical protein